MIRSFFIYLTACLLFSSMSQAGGFKEGGAHPFYVGAMGGYGSTTWGALVPASDNINVATNLSTPIRAQEGGGVWGFYTGYELLPTFALELSYLKYPSATVFFDPDNSMFAFEHDGESQFSTETQTLNLTAKLMFYIPKTAVRAFSSVGVATIHRKDQILDKWQYDPSFWAGFNYPAFEHLMLEVAANYTAGYGEAQLDPTSVYIPFLYAIVFRAAYRF